MSYNVIQTTDTFRYPAGKVWGPYSERIDAETRVAVLKYFKGDGRIEKTGAAPCQERRGK